MKLELWHYYLPHAFIVIGSNGFFAAISDRGNYAYFWPGHGRKDFREFFLKIEQEWDYFVNRLAPTREYDGEATVRRIKEEIILRRRESRRCRDAGYSTRDTVWTREVAREKWDSLGFFEIVYSKEGFGRWFEEHGFDDPSDLYCTRYNNDAVSFVRELLAPLPEILRKELAEKNK